VARGLAFLHDKKFVHGNVRPSNILLDADMEPLLADLGIHRLIRSGDTLKPAAAAGAGRFGSKRSAKSLPDLSPPPGASPLAGPSGSGDTAVAQYQAPEGVKNPKANAKWDVYSLGMVLLELVAGRALTSLELCQWSSAEESGQQVFRLADAALRGEMAGREEALASCLRLGFACCAMAPHKRPSMKEVVAAMDRIPSPSSSAQ
jgi:serine/threonine protein kinase